MTVLFVVLPLALLASAVALAAFVWSVSRGQLDDLVTPAMRMLVDDETRKPASSVATNATAMVGATADTTADAPSE